MSAALSSLGIFHTAVSFVSIGAGFYSLIRDRKIDQKNLSGKIYLGSMLIASLTAFGITPHGFRIGHVLTLGILALLGTGVLAGKTCWFGRAASYLETASFSTTFFLLLVFATGETLTRLPVSQPIAASFDAPVLKAVQGSLLVAFALGLGFQLFTSRGPAGGATDQR